MQDIDRANRMYWACIAASVAILTCSISPVSLWIDEGFIAWVVDHGTWPGLIGALQSPLLPSPADLQYPLYDLWVWGWVHVLGSSEYALRAANVPFAVLYVVALAAASRHAFNRRFAWVPLAFAPFIWFYMNEARPYLMLAALSTCTVAAAAVLAFGSEPVRSRARKLIVPFFLCAWLTHILAVLLVPGLIVMLVFARRERGQPVWPRWRTTVLIWTLPLVAVAALYAGTMLGKNGQTELLDNQNRGASPTAFAAEIVYEQLGFGGLGPARNDVRGNVGAAGFFPYLASLGLGVAGVAFVVFAAYRQGIDRATIVLLAAWAVSFLFALAASETMHARFLGRHMAATLPLLLMAVLSVLRTRSAGVVLALVLLLSDARLSVLPAYAKDDYRGAVADTIARARLLRGAIDWAADDLTANYYGLAFSNGERNVKPVAVPWPARANGVLVIDQQPAQAHALIAHQLATGRPVYLAVSKPDLYDKYAALAAAIKDFGAQRIAHYATFDIFVFSPRALVHPNIGVRAPLRAAWNERR
jgi:hypothetical protein